MLKEKAISVRAAGPNRNFLQKSFCNYVERRSYKCKSSRSQQGYYSEIILEEVILLKEEEAVRAAGPNPLCPPR